ncbi:hypothetical protein, partial [Papillibacter cinnamivorans]
VYLQLNTSILKDNEVKAFTPQALYAYVLGAITAGAFNAVSAAAEAGEFAYKSSAAYENTTGTLEKSNADTEISDSTKFRADYSAEQAVAIWREGKTFRNVIANLDTTVSDFFVRWKNGRKSHTGEKLEKLYLGKTTSEAAKQISEIVGYEIGERDYIITNDDIKHIYDQHGNSEKELSKGNLPLTKRVVDMLPEILASPDAVYAGHLENESSGRIGIIFEKMLDDGRIVYVQFDNAGRGTLQGRTLYIKAAGTSIPTVNASKGASTFTSETIGSEVPAHNSIAQNTGNVNSGKARTFDNTSPAESDSRADLDRFIAEWTEEIDRQRQEQREQEILDLYNQYVPLNEETLASQKNKGYTGNEDTTEGAGNKAGIPKVQVDEILKTPKYSRPDPATYLKEEYITSHTTQFKDGVTKISYQAPSGYAGPPGGTFVMPTSVADDLIARAGGDVSELERLLGLDPGELGTNPVRIDIANPSGLRMPSGNEKGANFKWIPGGYTSGGIPEVIIDSPGPGQYIVRPIK